MERHIVSTEKAPKAIGAYSQAVLVSCDKLVFCSGQIPIDPSTGQLSTGDIKEQTHLVLSNLKAVLEAAGSSLSKVLKITVYLKNMDDFAVFNEVYGGFFESDPPARAAVQVGKLPKDVLVEADAIAGI